MFISFLNYLPFQRTSVHMFNVHFLFELFTLPENLNSHVQCSFPFGTIYPSREPQFTCSMFISFLNYLPFQRTSIHMFNVHFLFELFTLPENLSSRHCFCRVDVAQLLIFCIVLKGRCLSLWLLFNLSIACPFSFHHI